MDRCRLLLCAWLLLLGGCTGAVGFDFDGDGWEDANDCAPTDETIHPGADEVCGDALDNDCNGEIDERNASGCSEWYRDDDGDGSGATASACLCEAAAPYSAALADDCDDSDPLAHGQDLDGDGWTPCGGDCDDSDPALSPDDGDADGYSSCDGDCDDADPALQPADVDSDGASTCDGDCDDSAPELNIADADNDGASTCEGDCDDFDDDLNLLDADSDGFTSCGGDCDDTRGQVAPGAPDLCDTVLDNDCDGVTDPNESDDDTDGWSECGGDCDDTDPTLDLTDGDADGWVACLDCDDANPLRNPGLAEACDAIDNDCDGLIPPEELDGDGDGYLSCADCDDADPAIYPGAPELCNGGFDDDCDPTTDESVDLDGDGLTVCGGDCDDSDAAMNLTDGDADGYAPCQGDCDDTAQVISPAAFELCGDGLDNNCDGVVDVACVDCAVWVPADHPTLQAAVDAVVDGDAVCVSPGTWPGLLDYGGKAAHVLGIAGADLTILDGVSGGTVVTFDDFEGSGSLLQGFTVTGGDGVNGGGILVTSASPLLVDLVVTGNTAQNGAGLYVNYSEALALSSVTLADNTAAFDGGGFMFVQSSPAGLNLTIADNFAFGAGGGGLIEGWAVWSQNLPELANSQVSGNVADDGGGVAIYDSAPLFTNVIVAGNAAGSGGGFLFDGADAELVNVAVVGNDASVGGGGIALLQASPILTNTIVAWNTSGGPGAGLAADGSSAPAFGWSDLWGNLPDDVSGIADPTGTSGNIAEDPGFLGISDPDPLLWDLHVSPTSGVTDAGGPVLLDPDGSASDMGAFGGPGANGWDLDDDGYSAWWQPGLYDNQTYPWLGWDCDDMDPMAFPGVGACIADPTFVVPMCGLAPSLGPCRGVGTRIAVPQHHSLVRGEIPISLDVPAGSRFHVEIHGPGGVLRLRCEGVVEREVDDGLLAELAVATRTPDGNACNWDTGLTAYAYGDQYGPDTGGVPGWHEVAASVELPDGSTVHDRAMVFVGGVVSYVYGNEVVSLDGLVRLSFPEHAIDGPFRLFGIDPATSAQPVASWRILASSPHFDRPVGLRIDQPALRGQAVTVTAPSGSPATAVCGAWSDDGVFEGRLEGLPDHESLLVVGGDAANPECPPAPGPSPVATAGPASLDFEDGLQGALSRGARGAVVAHGDRADGRCVELRNPRDGNLGASLLRGPIDLRGRSVLSLDVRLSTDAEVDLYARVGGRWLELGLTGGLGDYPRLGVVPAGSAAVPRDAVWYSVSLDLSEHFGGAEPVLEELVLAGFSVGGYMGLSAARLPEGAAAWVDDVRLSAGTVRSSAPTASWAEARPITPGEGLAVYDFSGPDASVDLTQAEGGVAVVFEATRPGTFGGFYVPQDGADRDWGRWDALRFEIASSRGGAGIGVALKDDADQQTTLDIGRLAEPGWIGGPTTIEVPLAAFAGVDLTAVAQLVFPLDAGAEGSVRTVEVGRMELVRGGTAELVVGRFANGLTPWGAAPTLFHTREAGISALTTPVGQLISVWGVRSERDQESWAGWSIGLPAVDVAGYDELALRLKRMTGVEAPNLYLRGGRGETIVPMSAWLADTDDWQDVRIPMERLAAGSADLGQVRELVLAFEWAEADGAVLLDAVRFTSDPPRSRPRAAVEAAAADDGDGCGGGGAPQVRDRSGRSAPTAVFAGLTLLFGLSRRKRVRS